MTANSFFSAVVMGHATCRLRRLYRPMCVCVCVRVCLQLNELSASMQRIYSTATVCDRPGDTSGTCYPLDPGMGHPTVVVHRDCFFVEKHSVGTFFSHEGNAPNSGFRPANQRLEISSIDFYQCILSSFIDIGDQRFTLFTN